MNIFVGNLSFEAKDADVYKLFMGFSSVTYVSIVMDKKGKNSRGFAFLEMPQEQEAQAAIAALNDKDFMGRPLKIEPARPKPETARESRKKEKMPEELSSRPWEYPRQEKEFKRGGYKEGRRSRSFMKRRAEAGITEPLPERKNKENPMRWRKKKPWQKKSSEAKPWQKAEGEAKPWQKARSEAKPWQKARSEAKPWEKTKGGPKPWKKTKGKAYEKKNKRSY